MAVALIGIVVVLLTVGGADRLAAMLFPTAIPLQLGQWLLIGGLIFIASLIMAPTRSLMQLLLVQTTKLSAFVVMVFFKGALLTLTTLWLMGRKAWRGLKGRPS